MANLKEFFNKVSNNNRIYTREDIGNMSSNEFKANEDAIDYQLANLGVPTNSDMALSEDVVYVHSYTRDDGTEVKAHYRSKHGHLTGAASNVQDKLPEMTLEEYTLDILGQFASQNHKVFNKKYWDFPCCRCKFTKRKTRFCIFKEKR